MSPGAAATYSFGFLTAYGRVRCRFRAEMPLHSGSCSSPRCFSRPSIRPTVDVDVLNPAVRSSTTSLSLPQRGYCSLKDRTASTSCGEYSGCRTRFGRCERFSRVSRCFPEYRFFQR